MSDTEFKIGDVVALKSGGPKMTVAAIWNDGNQLVWETRWFDGNQLRRDGFSAAELGLPAIEELTPRVPR